MVSSLFLVSSTTVEAADITIIDEENDVYDLFENDTTNKYPNIDITKLEYVREGIHITVALTVNGVIEDLGNLEGGEEEIGDTIAYSIYFTTSYDTYFVAYVNKQCMIQYGEIYENITDYTVDGSLLMIPFELNNTEETYETISAEADFIQIDLLSGDMNYYMDAASDSPLEITTADIPEVGSTGQSVQFKVFPDYGQPPYTYIWDFGDETTSTDKNPAHTYTKAGTYDCSVTVTDQRGVSDSYSGEITIVTEGNGETGTPILLLLAVIIIIIVIGVVVVIWIIRR